MTVQRLIDASYAAERRGDWDAAHDLMVQAETLEKNLLESGINGQNIRPVTIDGDFYEVDAGGRTWGDLDDNQVAEWIREAKRGGFKGLKISELSDEAAYGVDRPATHFAVFDQAVVKPLFSQ